MKTFPRFELNVNLDTTNYNSQDNFQTVLEDNIPNPHPTAFLPDDIGNIKPEAAGLSDFTL